MASSPSGIHTLSRRSLLKKTLYFSSGLLAGGMAGTAAALDPDVNFTGPGLHLLALGDFGSKNENQAKVAQRMAKFAKELSQPINSVLALGDNFYGKMTPDRFERDFEKMYDAESLNFPFYACFGNHDYEFASYGRTPEPRKFEMQLEYARQNPTSRWKAPSKWYTVELPNAEAPLLKLIVLDSNVREGELTPQEKLEQKRFLEAEVAKETKAPWTWLVWHHPLFTQTTKRKDNERLLYIAEQALKSQRISVVIAGHDHNLQHLRMDGYNSDFIVCGAGGANTYEVSFSSRGFAKQVLGFNHFHISDKRIKAQFIDADGHCLHAFRRTLDGKTSIVS